MEIQIYNNHVSLILETFETAVYRDKGGVTLRFKNNSEALLIDGDQSYTLHPETQLSSTYVYTKGNSPIKWICYDNSSIELNLQMQLTSIVDINTGGSYKRIAFGGILNKLSKYFTVNQALIDLRNAGILGKKQTIKDINGDIDKLQRAANTLTDNVKVQNQLFYLYHKALGKSDADARYNPVSYGYCIRSYKRKVGFYFKDYNMSYGDKKIFARDSRSRTMSLNVGLLRTIIQYVQKHYDPACITVSDERINKTYVKPDRTYTFGGKTLWDYQQDSVDFILDTLSDTEAMGDIFSCINSILATNTGKTLILLAIAHNLFDPQVIIPCHTDLLFSKTVADYLELGVPVSCVCSYNSKRQCIKHLENKGIQERPLWDTLGEFCVVMLPTFVPRLEKGEYTSEQLNKYNIGIFDECEDIIQKSSKYFNLFINKLNLYYRIASSGSSKNIKSIEKRFEIVANFGKPRYKITNRQNIDRGSSLKGVFTMELFEFSYGMDTDEVLLNPRRLNIAVDWIKKHNINHTLFYIGRNKASIIQDIALALQDQFPNKVVKTLTGYTKDRSDIIDQVTAGDVNIFVTSSVVARGLNFSVIDSVVNYNPRAGSENTLQAIYGRPMRVHEGMTHYVGLDFFDATEKHAKYSYERYQLHNNPEHGCELHLTEELKAYLQKVYG